MLLVSVKNTTSEIIKWDFLSSQVVIDGKAQPAWTEWAGPIDMRWETLKPGDAFTWNYALPNVIWKDAGGRKIQWVTQGHASNVMVVGWQADAGRAAEVLAVLAKTSQSADVLAELRGLRLIGRPSLVAGLKDVLSAGRGPFTGESYEGYVLTAALRMVQENKLGELFPQVVGCLKDESPAVVGAALLALAVLPEVPAMADLTPLAGNPDPIIRRYLAGSLGHPKIDRAQAVALLHRMIGAEDTLPGKTYEEHAFVRIWAAQRGQAGRSRGRGGADRHIRAEGIGIVPRERAVRAARDYGGEVCEGPGVGGLV